MTTTSRSEPGIVRIRVRSCRYSLVRLTSRATRQCTSRSSHAGHLRRRLGGLEPGTMIPSVRELGPRLLVHPNTVARRFRSWSVRACDRLAVRGTGDGGHGAGAGAVPGAAQGIIQETHRRRFAGGGVQRACRRTRSAGWSRTSWPGSTGGNANDRCHRHAGADQAFRRQDRRRSPRPGRAARGHLRPAGRQRSGKSTTIRMLTGQLQADAGRGRRPGPGLLAPRRRLRHRVGYVPERPQVLRLDDGRGNRLVRGRLSHAGLLGRYQDWPSVRLEREAGSRRCPRAATPRSAWPWPWRSIRKC